MKELSPTDKSKGCKLTKIGLLEASFTQRSPFLRFKYKKRILMYTIPVCVGVCACARTCAQTVKDPPVMQETWVESLGWKDALEEGMATHSNILAWRIPWIEEPGRLQSMGLQRVGHD